MTSRMIWGRPFVDLDELGVPHQLLHRVPRGVSHSAVDLDGLGRRLHGRIRREGLGHGRLLGVPPSLVGQPRRLPDQEPGGLDRRGHVGQHELDRLVVPRMEDPELDPFPGVAGREIEGRPGHAHGAQRQIMGRVMSRAIMARFEPLPFLPQEVLPGNPHNPGR